MSARAMWGDSPPTWPCGTRLGTVPRYGPKGHGVGFGVLGSRYARSMEPLDRSTVWPYDERGEPGAFVYQRYAHPTGAAAERALGALEGGDALLFGSGTAAVTACVVAFAKPGTTVALAEGAYFGTGVTLKQFEPWGLEVVEFDQTQAPPLADVVWLESPANPVLTTPDWDS